MHRYNFHTRLAGPSLVTMGGPRRRKLVLLATILAASLAVTSFALAGNWSPNTRTTVEAISSRVLFEIPTATAGQRNFTCPSLIITGSLTEPASTEWESNKAVTFSHCYFRVNTGQLRSWKMKDEALGHANLELPAKAIEIEFSAGCYLISRAATLGMARNYVNGTNRTVPSLWEILIERFRVEDPARCDGGAEKTVTISLNLLVRNTQTATNEPTINVN